MLCYSYNALFFQFLFKTSQLYFYHHLMHELAVYGKLLINTVLIKKLLFEEIIIKHHQISLQISIQIQNAHKIS